MLSRTDQFVIIKYCVNSHKTTLLIIMIIKCKGHNSFIDGLSGFIFYKNNHIRCYKITLKMLCKVVNKKTDV